VRLPANNQQTSQSIDLGRIFATATLVFA